MRYPRTLFLFAFLPFMAQAQTMDWLVPLELDVPFNGSFPSTTIAVQESGEVAVFGLLPPITSWGSQRLGTLAWRVFDADGQAVANADFPAEASAVDMVVFDGAYFVIGAYKDSLQFPGHPQLSTVGLPETIGHYVCRIEVDGTVVWVKDAADLELGVVQTIAVSPSGMIHLGAWNYENAVVARLDPAGAPLDMWPLEGVGLISDIAVNAAGTVCVAGSCLENTLDLNGTALTHPFAYTIFTARFGSDGDLQQHLIIEDVTCPLPRVELDDAGNTYLSGDVSIPVQVGPFTLTDPAWVFAQFLIQVDAAGTVSWLNQPVPGNGLGDAGRARGRDLVLHPEGGVWQGGNARGSNDWGNGISTFNAIPGQQLYFRRVGADGLTQQIATSESGSFGQTVHSLATDGNALYMLGYAYDTLHLGGMEFPEQDYHIFLTRWEDLSSGVEEVPSAALRIHPNPATDRITLDLSTINGPVQVDLFDAVGRVVAKRREQGSGYRNMDVATLRPGAYLLRMHAGEQLMHARFIKE